MKGEKEAQGTSMELIKRQMQPCVMTSYKSCQTVLRKQIYSFTRLEDELGQDMFLLNKEVRSYFRSYF